MRLPVPPQKFAKFMKFVARKSKNAKTLMSAREMYRQFIAETESRIHATDGIDAKFDAMFESGARVVARNLIRMKKYTEVDFANQMGPIEASSSSSAEKKRESESDTFGVQKIIPIVPEASKKAEDNSYHADFPSVDVFVLSENLANNFPRDKTSVRDLLILIRGTLMSLESIHLNGLREKIEEKIQKLSGKEDQLVSLETINLPFDMCLCLLKKHAYPKSEDESTSLRRFMTSLQIATCHLVHPSMDPFHEKVNAYLDELDVQDQVIPIKIVQNAMDAILNFIEP